MFGIGFTELLLIAIIAILFLGPDKLPTALVDMAKFIKSVKKTIGDAKNSIEEEMKIADLKAEAMNYKQQLDDANDELKNFKNIDFDTFAQESSSKKLAQPTTEKDDTMVPVATPVEPKNDTVTFQKKTQPKTSKGDA